MVIALWWTFISFLWPSGFLLLPVPSSWLECHLHFASIKLCQASWMWYRFCRSMLLSLLFYSSMCLSWYSWFTNEKWLNLLFRLISSKIIPRSFCVHWWELSPISMKNAKHKHSASISSKSLVSKRYFLQDHRTLLVFDWFLSGFEWILNFEFCLLKLLIFYQKLLWNIRSRLNSSTFWVFRPVFRYVWSKLKLCAQKTTILIKDIKYRLKNSKCGRLKPISDIP